MARSEKQPEHDQPISSLIIGMIGQQLRDAERGIITLRFMVVWDSCQWSSVDGTEEELFEMYKHKGIPGEIRIETL